MEYNEMKLKVTSTTDIIKELKSNRIFTKEEADDLVDYLTPTCQWLTGDEDMETREVELLRSAMEGSEEVMVKKEGWWYKARVSQYCRPNDLGTGNQLEVTFDLLNTPRSQHSPSQIVINDPYVWKSRGKIRFTG